MDIQVARIRYLDAIRGSMIIWMLIVHISLNYGYIKFGDTTPSFSMFTLMSFFMTPFYVFSGYLFSSKRDFWDYTMNKVRKLLVPYLFFTLFGIMIFESWSLYAIHNIDTSFLSSFIPTASFKTNTPCWFFISLFFVSEIYYLLSKWGGVKMHAVIALCFLMAYLTKGKTQYFGYGNILLGLTYFHLGHLLKVYEQTFQSKIKMIMAMSVTVYLIVGLFFPTSLSFVVNLLTRGNYFLNLLFSLSACLILYYLFRGISAMHEKNKMIELLSYYGRISLVVFAFHRPILNWCFDPMLKYFIPDVSYPIFLGCNLVLILVCASAFNSFAKRYIPRLI